MRILILTLFLTPNFISGEEPANKIAHKIISSEFIGFDNGLDNTVQGRKKAALNNAQLALSEFMSGDKVPERVQIAYALNKLNVMKTERVLIVKDGSWIVDHAATLKRKSEINGQIKTLENRLVELMYPNLYLVKKGDSMWGVSQKLNLSLEALMKANNNKNGLLEVGQWLVVPTK